MRIRNLHIAVFFVAAFALQSCHRSWQVQSYETGYYKMNQEERDSSMLAFIKPYHDSLETEMGVVLTNLPHRLNKEKPNGSLGFFTCDAFRAGVAKKINKRVDISVLNNGGIRRPYLGPGPVSTGAIYELMPFDNRAMLLELDSQAVAQLVEFLISKGGDPISGLEISADSVTKIKVNGLPLRTQNYLLACTDYQYNGGDGYGFLQSAKVVSADLGLLRDILIDAIRGRDFMIPFNTERRYFLGN